LRSWRGDDDRRRRLKQRGGAAGTSAVAAALGVEAARALRATATAGTEANERGRLGDSIYRLGCERSGLKHKESHRENQGFGREINSKTNPNSR
jgi:hypothetical protein